MQDRKDVTRRDFITTASAGAAAVAAGTANPVRGAVNKTSGKLAILGGDPVRSNKQWPRWPYWDESVPVSYTHLRAHET